MRREILALEALGAQVVRVSVRSVNEELVDESDKNEADKTHTIINSSKFKSIGNLLFHALLCLPRITRCFGVWLQLVHNARDDYLKHFFYWAEACWLLKFSDRQGVSHIHAHFGTNPATVAILCHAMGGPTYSITFHGPEEFDSPRQLSLGLKVQHAKFVVAITSFCRSQLFRWVEFAWWDKVKEVHCSVDELNLAAAPKDLIPSGCFLSIGRFCEQKGQMLLLGAFARLHKTHPDAVLHLVGDGEMRQLLEAFIAEKQLQDSVVLHGWQNETKIIELLDASTVMVLPSFAEGLPVVIMESFARRTPVITTYIAGIPELVDEQTGWLIPAGCEESLLNAMQLSLSTTEKALRDMGEQAIRKVRARHSAITEAKQLLSFMEMQS